MRRMKTQFSIWFQEEMDRQGLSQNRLARMMGVSVGSVNRWYHGAKLPGPKSCRDIARALNVAPDTVLAMAGHRPPPAPLDESSLEANLIHSVQAIDWTADERMYRLIRDMLDSILTEQSGLDMRRVAPSKEMAARVRNFHVVSDTDFDPDGH